jgi:hypothetical protein
MSAINPGRRSMDQSFYSTLSETIGRVLTTGAERTARLAAIPDAWDEEDAGLIVGTPHIPTQDHDPLLNSVRGHWRRPLTLQRKDFEARFAMKERRVVPVEEVLADIRAGKFATAAAMARYYGKPPSWVGSFMWFCLREKLVSDTATFHGYFPKRRTRTCRGTV